MIWCSSTATTNNVDKAVAGKISQTFRHYVRSFVVSTESVWQT